METKVDLPYPSLEGLKEDRRSLRILSPAYAGGKGELTAVLQYVYQSITFEKLGMPERSKTLLGIAVNEMHHLELLGTAIIGLGAPPVFTACPPYPVGYFSACSVNYSKHPQSMIAVDIAAESEAIADYKRILSRLCDPILTALVERIIADEEYHLSIFKKMQAELSEPKAQS